MRERSAHRSRHYCGQLALANIRLQLNETMATSELPETLLVTAGLCALLDMLEGDGLSRRDAKAFIARSLNALRE